MEVTFSTLHIFATLSSIVAMPVLAMSPGTKNAVDKPRFELPALKLDFGNITDGTNIPPPLPSPKVPTPPQTPPAHETNNSVASGNATASKTNGPNNGTSHPEERAPLSPAPSARQGTLRRMLSKRTMNNTAAESQLPGSQCAPMMDGPERPQSRGGFSLMGDRQSKRNSGWFRRFRTGDQPSSRRSSFLFGGSSNNLSAMRQTEPPPPMIPELRELEKDEGSLGSDIFQNIK